MTARYSALERLSDDDLVAEVKRLAASERQATAALIASLCEFDSRRLYLGAGCSSLFTYCTRILALSEDAAYFRIEAARAARRFPAILGHLADGGITLTAVKLLAPHLTEDNHLELLDAARGQGKRHVEEMVARLRPRPDVPSAVRKLPATRGTAPLKEERSRSGGATSTDRAAETAREASTTPAPIPLAPLLDQPFPAPVAPSPRPAARRAVVAPLAPQRYKVQMTVGAETHAKLCRAQDLLRHAIPDGDPAAVFDRALTVLLEQLERRKFAATSGRRRPAPNRSTPEDAATLEPAVPSANPEQATTFAAPNDCHLAPRLVPERVEARATRRRARRQSRYIPATVRRSVWKRDGGQCAFVGSHGRCAERGKLEYHHVVPYAAGGGATADNIVLACAAHNRYEADRFFGMSAVKGGDGL